MKSTTIVNMSPQRCTREIVFRGPHWEADQAPFALRLLQDSPIIQSTSVTAKNRVSVQYDPTQVTFPEIESALQELGFHLDNGLLTRLRRAYYGYCDETLQANYRDRSQCMGYCARKIFVREYQKQSHGCQDERPSHWRSYW